LKQEVIKIIEEFISDTTTQWTKDEFYICVNKQLEHKNIGLTLCEYVDVEDNPVCYTLYIYNIDSRTTIEDMETHKGVTSNDFNYLAECYNKIRDKIFEIPSIMK